MNPHTGEVKALADLTAAEKEEFRPVPEKHLVKAAGGRRKKVGKMVNINSPLAKQMADFIEQGDKVVMHGGRTVLIGGRQFPASYLDVAKWMVRMRREARKRELGARAAEPADTIQA